jgi:hypothetical protein
MNTMNGFSRSGRWVGTVGRGGCLAVRWVCGLWVCVGLLWSGPGVAQVFDDFDDGNDDGWTRLDLSVIGSGAEFTFPDDGAGGLAYRIFAPTPSVATVGPARAFSYRANEFSRMEARVDMLNWDPTINQAYGFLIRATDIALGSTKGYVMNYNSLDGNLQINEVSNEAPTTIAQTAVPMFPDSGPYRWVFTAYDVVLLGQVFSMSDLQNPLGSVFAQNGTYPSGRAGLFVFDRNGPATYTYADATFDNYSVTVPAAGTLGAVTVELSPRPLEVTSVVQPPIRVSIVNRETAVDLGSIRFWLDGVEVSAANLDLGAYVEMPGNPGAQSGATMIYESPTPFEPGRTYTARVVFQDDLGTSSTNEWTFMGVPLLRAEHALPPDAGEDRGFAVRLVHTIGPESLANNLIRAEQQLAIPPEIPIHMETNTTARVINFTQNALPSADGYFPDEATFPGIDPAGDTDDFAMEALFYLELRAGLHRFGVRSDDGFQLSTGSSMAQVRDVVLGERRTGTYDGTFEFGVEADGLYPFRLVYFERGGGAHVELFSVDRENPELRTLINDDGESEAIRAWRTVSVIVPTVLVESAGTLDPGAFGAEPGAVVDTAARTITVPLAGGTRFYRLSSGEALTITGIAATDSGVVLTYE